MRWRRGQPVLLQADRTGVGRQVRVRALPAAELDEVSTLGQPLLVQPVKGILQVDVLVQLAVVIAIVGRVVPPVPIDGIVGEPVPASRQRVGLTRLGIPPAERVVRVCRPAVGEAGVPEQVLLRRCGAGQQGDYDCGQECRTDHALPGPRQAAAMLETDRKGRCAGVLQDVSPVFSRQFGPGQPPGSTDSAVCPACPHRGPKTGSRLTKCRSSCRSPALFSEVEQHHPRPIAADIMIIFQYSQTDKAKTAQFMAAKWVARSQPGRCGLFRFCRGRFRPCGRSLTPSNPQATITPGTGRMPPRLREGLNPPSIAFCQYGPSFPPEHAGLGLRTHERKVSHAPRPT